MFFLKLGFSVCHASLDQSDATEWGETANGWTWKRESNSVCDSVDL